MLASIAADLQLITRFKAAPIAVIVNQSQYNPKRSATTTLFKALYVTAVRRKLAAKMAEKIAMEGSQRELPNVYFNGFQLGLTNADINGVLILNNQPALGISMSFTTAKTFAVALNDIIATLEKVTEREIMSTHQVNEGLTKLSDSVA